MSLKPRGLRGKSEMLVVHYRPRILFYLRASYRTRAKKRAAGYLKNTKVKGWEKWVFFVLSAHSSACLPQIAMDRIKQRAS